ncbi:group II intron reverse transcriptase/maturase (plasmid) [Bradyrhizobium barranii subsp. apii]|uniref:group II intron reverse transcriptase/maturase n=1 Tax=Bradyrhizobium TaxID=374 RepID=UPI0014083AA2|nr:MULTISPECIES: group II intron reverse transcriptase/maturase [Bradyrhizobium]MCK7665251.1 group II intron reverse transcriptase/maturase [Bradyrhizobium sp. 2S1]MCK7666088.1 group II intron reverse transcriptase/maturase [Bradyrhizobium sp. 2S1]MCK7666229.1 group II intron reverse transcriptase/maturase [Bradyrhizobium sp. 2S1]MCK7666543.1 group II intron reverse transcriptase/maturase [Bradyrhizobium sp. 2S1]MCK7666561.1 group II intron reverse transcriptase/maturase [Bradyrhizobium sp. 2S
MKAYRLVKANAGSAGVDKVSLEAFEKDLKGNLYKVWNRMSSGSYFPPAVRAVSIPKKNGGQRILGVPTVADRVAQTVVKLQIEQALEEIFLPDSYGYRPGKSALDAVGVTRQRCWRMDWVLEFDIKGLFDNISHKLLMKAVRKHVQDEWALLYIERWLTAPMQDRDGAITARDRGTPQGGVISPVLANLFLHYAFDTWMARNFPQSPWCRYADDGLVHCRTKAEAEAIKAALQARFKECELEMHPDKTKIVYCKDSNRPGSHASQSFDFLGFTFRPRRARNHQKKENFCTFSPAVSRAAMTSMRMTIRQLRLRLRSQTEVDAIALELNPVLRGWRQYYGRYGRSEMHNLYRYVDESLNRWARRKYKGLKNGKVRASTWLRLIRCRRPKLFAHWAMLSSASLLVESRMT